MKRVSPLLLLLLLGACGGGPSAPAEPAATPAPAGGEAEPDGATSSFGPELSEGDRALLALLGDEPRAPIPILTRRPRLGPENAPITIVLFSDMQCPFCARVMPTLERVLAHYGDRVRLFWAHLPLPMHPQADVAARVSVAVFEAAGDAAFFQFLDALTSDLGDFSDARIEALAVGAGADPDAVVEAIEEYRFDEVVMYDRRVASAIGVRGTPFMLVNGRAIAGAQPFDAFVELIDDELRVVRELHAAGVPSGREYETLVRLVFGPEVAEQMTSGN